MSQYGRFYDFCRDSGSRFATIPVCNLFNESPARSGDSAVGFSGCELTGIGLSNDRRLANLGSILLNGVAIVITLGLLFLANRKRAAVGRREMQYFLFGYLIISICEIFTIGGFPLDGAVRRAFTAVHIAAVVATAWVLLLNAIVGFQIMEDGTPLSMALIIGSSLAFIVGVGYIALDTAFSWTGYWDDTLGQPNRAYALYTLYLLVPLIFVVAYFVAEAFLVVVVLGERRPLLYLFAAALLFAIGQIFQFVVSVHICNGVDGKINGGMFEVFFTLLSVIMIWVFWSSITEDDWPTAGTPGYS